MAAPAALPGAAAAEPAVVVTTREPGGDESACPGQFWKRGWKSTAALTIGKPPRAPRV